MARIRVPRRSRLEYTEGGSCWVIGGEGGGGAGAGLHGDGCAGDDQSGSRKAAASPEEKAIEGEERIV